MKRLQFRALHDETLTFENRIAIVFLRSRGSALRSLAFNNRGVTRLHVKHIGTKFPVSLSRILCIS